ncbi:MAG: cation diffusion facilitator family transporter [Gemmatimonadaceae bacterium]|nr:cation diffusion facilitator family transporter [Gemmatimonadaceae bacterium]
MTAARENTDATYPDCATHRQRARSAAHRHAHGHEGHDHPHDHAYGARGLAWALAITAVVLVAEIVGGWLSNSLALLADAGHMLTDAGALALSLFVAWLARQPAAPEKTYGYVRWEILAALINGATLLVVSAGIVWEALGRLRTPEPVETGVMLAVAVLGLIANLVAAWLLHAGASHSLNLRGAYLHVLGDLLGSVATILAALAVRWLAWPLADPIASIIVTLLIIRGAWRLTREAVDVLVEATPRHISVPELREALAAITGVTEVHDLHVWTLTSGVVALSAHVVVPDGARHQQVLEDAHAVAERFGIAHSTVQLEGQVLKACVA